MTGLSSSQKLKIKLSLIYQAELRAGKALKVLLIFFLILIHQGSMALFQAQVAGNKKKYFNSLNKLISDTNLSEHLTFCGARSDIANVYKISDIVMNLSSKPEPFGRTIIEAAACGSHVMGWDRGGCQGIY
jgi:glycosyltransferase involved in cell wall biosynthesis